MQSNRTRRTRHLLVTAGVITLVLAGVAPTAASAGPPEHAGGPEVDVGRPDHVENDRGPAGKVQLCHRTGSDTNTVVGIDVNGNANHDEGHRNHVGEDENEKADGSSCGSDAEDEAHQEPAPAARSSSEESSSSTGTPAEPEGPADAPSTGSGPVAELPERPASPIQIDTPAPTTEISSDSVEAPTTNEAPQVEPPTRRAGQPEVLGVTTTRTPTRELRGGAVDPITSLPRTGIDSTAVLSAVGTLLVLAGIVLGVLGRRGRSSAGGVTR